MRRPVLGRWPRRWPWRDLSKSEAARGPWSWLRGERQCWVTARKAELFSGGCVQGEKDLAHYPAPSQGRVRCSPLRRGGTPREVVGPGSRPTRSRPPEPGAAGAEHSTGALRASRSVPQPVPRPAGARRAPAAQTPPPWALARRPALRLQGCPRVRPDRRCPRRPACLAKLPGQVPDSGLRDPLKAALRPHSPCRPPPPPSSRAWKLRWKGRWTGTPSPGAIKISSPSSSRPSSSSTSARADRPTARSSGRRGRVRLSPPRFVTATRRRTPRVDGFSTSARTSATCSTLARTHGGSSLLCSYQNAAARRTRAPLRARAPSRRKASSPPRSSPPRTPLAFRIRQDAPALRSLRPSHRRQRQLRRAGWQMRRDFRPSASRDTQPPAPMRKARRCDEATSHSELSACRRGGVWETPTSSVPGGSPASKLATVVESPACGLE